MPSHDIVVIGASAGGLDALSRLASQLPGDLPAAIFVVIHMAPGTTSLIAEILDRAGQLPATQAVDGARIKLGRLYVAAPNHHLLVKDGFMSVAFGPKENRHRPAIDPLFRSAARAYGARVVGLLMSGGGDDGVSGLRAIHQRGGVTVVQDPDDAMYGELPANALQSAPIDHSAPVVDLGTLLTALVAEPAPPSHPDSGALRRESRMAEADIATIEDEHKLGRPSVFSCPECGGVLWEIEEGDVHRFRCRVGHAYSTSALADEQREALEKGLWAAFRALEERASLAKKIADRAHQNGAMALEERFTERADEARESADAIRRILLQLETSPEVTKQD